MNLVIKQKQIPQAQKINMWLPEWKGGGRGINYELGISRYKLFYIKYINKVLLYSAENYIQYPKNMKKNIYL